MWYAPGMADRSEPDPADLLMRVTRTLRRRTFRALAPWELAPHQVRALRVIGREEPLRLGRLADYLRITPRSVTDAVDALCARGLVERHPDADDRRAITVRLSDEGRVLLKRVEEARQADATAFFATLPARDRDHLTRILGRLIDDHADDAPGVCHPPRGRPPG